MVTISAPHRPPRATLGALLAARDASLAVRRSDSLAAVWGKLSKGASRSARTLGQRITAVFALLALLIGRHGLVLAGLGAFTAAAWQYSLIAGLVTAGAGAFFLEARRK